MTFRPSNGPSQRYYAHVRHRPDADDAAVGAVCDVTVLDAAHRPIAAVMGLCLAAVRGPAASLWLGHPGGGED